jgi:hypothetical protein
MLAYQVGGTDPELVYAVNGIEKSLMTKLARSDSQGQQPWIKTLT